MGRMLGRLIARKISRMVRRAFTRGEEHVTDTHTHTQKPLCLLLSVGVSEDEC